MTNPISTISAAHAAQRSTPDATIATRTTGLSSVSDSMSAPVAIPAAGGKGFFATISGFFANIWENIRSCLAKLPLIGRCFEPKAAPAPVPVPTPTPTPTPSPAPTLTDVQILNMIRGQFPDASAAAPDDNTVNELIEKFKKLNTPIAKIEAFNTIMNATNSTPEICKKFYNILPVGNLSDAQLISGNRQASQTSLRFQMWRNNISTANPTGNVFNGVDFGAGLGQEIVNNHIRSNLAKSGARRLADIMQLETFQAAIAATNATDDSVRAAWKALPQALRNEMAGEIWNVNNASGGNDGGNANYGADFAKNNPRDAKVAQATINLRNNKL